MEAEGIGGRIKQEREAHGLTQKELARRVEVSEKSVSNWENEKHAAPRNIARIAVALNVPVAWLLRGDVTDHEVPDSIGSLLEQQAAILRELRLLRADLLYASAGG